MGKQKQYTGANAHACTRCLWHFPLAQLSSLALTPPPTCARLCELRQQGLCRGAGCAAADKGLEERLEGLQGGACSSRGSSRREEQEEQGEQQKEAEAQGSSERGLRLGQTARWATMLPCNLQCVQLAPTLQQGRLDEGDGLGPHLQAGGGATKPASITS